VPKSNRCGPLLSLLLLLFHLSDHTEQVEDENQNRSETCGIRIAPAASSATATTASSPLNGTPLHCLLLLLRQLLL